MLTRITLAVIAGLTASDCLARPLTPEEQADVSSEIRRIKDEANVFTVYRVWRVMLACQQKAGLTDDEISETLKAVTETAALAKARSPEIEVDALWTFSGTPRVLRHQPRRKLSLGALTAVLEEIEAIHKGHEEFVGSLELAATKLSGMNGSEARTICLKLAEGIPPLIRKEMGIAPRP